MKCKFLNSEVTIEKVDGFDGIYKTINSIYDLSYSYYRPASKTYEYNTHFTVYPTDKGEAEFETFHISLNFSSTGGIRNAKIFYKKGKYTGYDDENLTHSEKKIFLAFFKHENDHFNEMASQFWIKVQQAEVGNSLAEATISENQQRIHIQRIKQSVEDELLAGPGVTAIDIDYKIINGIKSNELAIIVFVEKKKTVSSDEEIPISIKGIKTDIWEGSFSPFSTTIKNPVKKPKSDIVDSIADPIIGGVSVGPCNQDSYGTLGIVLDTSFGVKMMLSSTHVLATGPHTAPGDPISQPAIPFGGDCPTTTAGSFFMGFIGQPSNIDASLATIPDRNAVSNTILEIGETTGPDVALPGDNVAKFGRRTQFTTGRVESNTFTFSVHYPSFGTFTYYNQLRIEASNPNLPFALPGDSGSIIINEDKKVVGMVMSGSDTGDLFTIANPIQDIISVFEAEGIRFV